MCTTNLLRVIFFSLLPAINCIFLMYKVEAKVNQDVVNITSTIFNDGLHDTLLNMTVQYFVAIEKETLYIKFNLPSFEGDDRYQLRILTTVTDMNKFMKGINGNFITKSILERLSSAINFPLQFPLEPKIYNFVNVSIPDHYIPLKNTKYLAELRYVGKIRNRKGMDFICRLRIYATAELTKIFNVTSAFTTYHGDIKKTKKIDKFGLFDTRLSN